MYINCLKCGATNRIFLHNIGNTFTCTECGTIHKLEGDVDADFDLRGPIIKIKKYLIVNTIHEVRDVEFKVL